MPGPPVAMEDVEDMMLERVLETFEVEVIVRPLARDRLRDR